MNFYLVREGTILGRISQIEENRDEYEELNATLKQTKQCVISMGFASKNMSNPDIER